MASSVLAVNDDLPVRTNSPVHSGKVRSVYWLTPEDSARLIKERWYVCASLLLPLLLRVFLFGHIQLSHFIYIYIDRRGVVKEEVHQHPLLWSDRHCCAFLLTCRLPRASTMTHVTAMMCQTIHHWQLWCKLFINIYAVMLNAPAAPPPARPHLIPPRQPACVQYVTA